MATTILDSLKTLNRYPVPSPFLESTLIRYGVDGGEALTADIINGAAYNLVKADVFVWLSDAPDISQGGQTYGFTDEQRVRLRNEAYAIYREYGKDMDGISTPTPLYGHKGSRL